MVERFRYVAKPGGAGTILSTRRIDPSETP